MENNQPSAAAKMNILDLLKNIMPFVLPYRWLIGITLALTLVGSLMAQVNAVVLDKAVDSINALIQQPQFSWGSAARILTTISIILLGKEVIAALVTFFQRYYGERMRILVSRDLSLSVVKRMLSFRMAFFTAEGNETGKLQSRIDRGIMSLSNTVNNFFIEILPLFTSAILALALMFMANVYLGLVALCIVPIYFYVTYIQAKRMKGGRRGIFGGHQAVSQSILNILESITVIKSFNRENIEAKRQAEIQPTMTDLQRSTRKQIGSENRALTANTTEKNRFRAHRTPPFSEDAGTCSIAENAQYCAHCPQPIHMAASMHAIPVSASFDIAGQPSVAQTPHERQSPLTK